MKKAIINYFVMLSLTFVIINVCSAQTETKIPGDSLPALVHNELNKNYALYSVNSISRKVDQLQNSTYKIEVQKKSTVIELHYDKQGKLINKEKSKVYTYDGTEKTRSPSPSSPGKSGDGHNH
ncbi:MAG: hypothetical protein Q7W13_00260 [Bacteroidia bacterium]|nr:hypothetical protein [Bacteroidia bacterium]